MDTLKSIIPLHETKNPCVFIILEYAFYVERADPFKWSLLCCTAMFLQEHRMDKPITCSREAFHICLKSFYQQL